MYAALLRPFHCRFFVAAQWCCLQMAHRSVHNTCTTGRIYPVPSDFCVGGLTCLACVCAFDGFLLSFLLLSTCPTIAHLCYTSDTL